MNEPVNPRTHCTHCRAELTKDEVRGCLVCLVCHPPVKIAPKEEVIIDRRVDVKPDENRVLELIDERIKKLVPGMIQEDREEWMLASRVTPTVSEPTADFQQIDIPDQPSEQQKSWRDVAKELGIPLFQRTKVEVLADIDAKQNVTSEQIGQ